MYSAAVLHYTGVRGSFMYYVLKHQSQSWSNLNDRVGHSNTGVSAKVSRCERSARSFLFSEFLHRRCVKTYVSFGLNFNDMYK